MRLYSIFTPIIWIAGCLMLFGAMPVFADIYMYVDSQGTMHFTNAPTSSDFQIYVRERPKRARIKLDTDRFDRFINEAAMRHGVDFPLLKAVIRAESAFDPKAVSHKGALGLMQIMPANLKTLRVYDAFDPWQNIMGGARYLKTLLQRFKGEVPLALAAYNAGPGAVDIHRGIPPFSETQNYVERVMKFFQFYKNG